MKFCSDSRRRRGAVLLATLFLVLVISMFLGAASQVGLRSLFTAGATSESALAESAAESGLQYALFRLRQNARWRGDGNGVIVDTPELLVKEDQGNVVGFLPHGRQFRMRFNYQDGDGSEGLPNPSMWIDHPYVSINNMMSGASRPVPRADGSGYSVTKNSRSPYKVPEFTVCLLVEGRAGSPVVRGNFDLKPLAGHVSTAVIEGLYRVEDISDVDLDAAAMSAKDFSVELPSQSGEVSVESRDGMGQPRVRSKGKVEVKGGDSTNYLSPDGQVLSGDGKLRARSGDSVKVGREDGASGFYELGWSEVQKADPATAGQLAAGTYVWWKDGSLHYYDMDFDDYVKHIRKNPSDEGVSPPVLPEGVRIKSDSKTLLVTEDVKVVKGKASELAIIPRTGAPEGPPVIDPAMQSSALGPSMASYYANNPDAFRSFLKTAFPGQGETGVPFGIDIDPTELGLTKPDFQFSNVNDPEAFTFEVTTAGASNLLPDGNWTNQLEWHIASLFVNHDLAGQSRSFLEEAGEAGPGAIDLPGVNDDLAPADITLNFEPETGETAILTAPGNIRIGTQLKGQGGSIVSEGSIRVIGFGADFAANPNAESGISMYAKQNIAFSTYRYDKAAKSGEFQDVKIRGVLYAWGNIRANLGHHKIKRWGRFDLEGAMVAYGGKPGTAERPGTPGSSRRGGDIAMTVSGNRLIFDPAYLLSLMSHGQENVPMRRILWKRY